MRTRTTRTTPFNRALLAMIFALVSAFTPAEDNDLAPNWELDSVDGSNVNFHHDTRGLPSVLMFWATWCPYCRDLFPHIEAVREDYAAKGVRFFALNVFEDGDPVAYFVEHGYGMTQILAGDLVAEDYGVVGTPSVFVVDGSHHVRYRRQRGEDPAAVEKALRATLDAVLKEQAK